MKNAVQKLRIAACRGVARSAIRKDLMFFMIPWFLIFSAGLLFCVRDGLPDLPGAFRETEERPAAALPGRFVPGLLLFLPGLTVAVIGRITLRRSYAAAAVILRNHRLVTHGIFRYTRNPIYLGVLLISFAFPVWALSLKGFAVMLLLIPVILVRIRLEEDLLARTFGTAFLEYKKRTKRLVPFVY